MIKELIIIVMLTALCAYPVLGVITAYIGKDNPVSISGLVPYGSPNGAPWAHNVNASNKNITNIQQLRVQMPGSGVGREGSRFTSTGSPTQYPLNVYRNNTKVAHISNYGAAFLNGGGSVYNGQWTVFQSIYGQDYVYSPNFGYFNQIWGDTYDLTSYIDCASYGGSDFSSSYGMLGNDHTGYIDLTTGTSPASSDAVCAITYGGVVGSCPGDSDVIIQPRDKNTADYMAVNAVAIFALPTATGYTLQVGTNPLAGDTKYAWTYWIACRQ